MNNVELTLIICLIVALLCSFAISWRLVSSLVKPSRMVTDLLSTFSEGNIEVNSEDVTYLNNDLNNRRDEMGQMSIALQSLREYLSSKAKTAHEIAQHNLNTQSKIASNKDVLGISFDEMISSLNSAFVEVQDASKMVNSGASQLRDASSNLADGATEQASSIEEVSASLLDFESGVQKNTQQAVEANKLASDTVRVANEGSEKMEQMSDSMVRIEQSAQQTQAIIGTIDDIAFQTNLLALNAAVEAARAGQHGKGFAVVAEEVRNLATRSAKAAGETAELIKGSNHEITSGVELSQQTAEAFRKVAENVRDVDRIIDEIAGASQTQTKDLKGVNEILATIESITQNSAANAEETSSSSQEMSSQATILHQLVSSYQLRDTEMGEEIIAEWKPEYSVKIKDMDEQHQRLFMLTNQLYSAIQRGSGRDMLAAVFRGLKDYTQDHFASEERLMKRYHYPNLKEHARSHQQLTAHVEELAKKFARAGSDQPTPQDIISFLQDFLATHILREDKDYGDYITRAR